MKKFLEFLRILFGIYIGGVMLAMIETENINYEGLFEGLKYLLYISPLVALFYFYKK